VPRKKNIDQIQMAIKSLLIESDLHIKRLYSISPHSERDRLFLIHYQSLMKRIRATFGLSTKLAAPIYLKKVEELEREIELAEKAAFDISQLEMLRGRSPDPPETYTQHGQPGGESDPLL
jgi:hypothetical protein